jgi:hypothetical protein
MEPLIQIVAFLLTLVAFASGALLVTVQPLWGIIDAAMSPKLSSGAKVAIILLTLLLLGPLMTIGYALTQPGLYRKATVTTVVVCLGSVIAIMALAAISQATDLPGVQQAAADDTTVVADVTDPTPPTSTSPYPDPVPPAATEP